MSQLLSNDATDGNDAADEDVAGDNVMDQVLGAGFSRRKLLKGGGAMVVGFSMAGSLLAGKAQAAPARVAAATAGPPDMNLIDSWIAIHADNTATVFIGKINITGSPFGLMQIAAEELDLGWDQMKEVRADTNVTPNQGFTAGSNSISSGGPQVRQAAAEARAVLLGLASKQLGVPVSQLNVDKGVVSVKTDASKKVTYGSLLGDKAFAAPNTGRAPLKAVTDYKIVGKPFNRPDTPAKVTGSYIYSQNVRVPGMLHGRVVRPGGQGPYTQPVKALSVDESSIKKIKGARVVRRDNFIGVVATTEQDAIQAAAELKVKWAESPTMPGNGNMWKAFRETKGLTDRVAKSTGSLAKGLEAATSVIEQSYSVGYQSHASMGPSAAVADVKSDSAKVTMAGQSIYGTRTAIAGLLNLKAEQVQVQFYEGAGCYGRNLQDDAAQAAAVMSQLVGAPVRVQLGRADEHGWDFYGPATLVDIRGSVDAAGVITSYDYVSFQQGWNLTETTQETLGTPIPAAVGGADVDNSGTQYAIANHRVIGRSIPVGTALPRVAYLRAPAAPQALFASEQMIDELAVAAKMDPIALRVKNITNERWLRVLAEASKAAGWQPKVSGSAIGTDRVLKGRGVAIGGFASTYVAVIADIEVDTRTGKIRVKHLTAAQDCGLVINPNLVEQQIEGCLIQGTSRALLEEVKFSKSRVTSLDWESYPVLRMKDAPDLTVVIVNRPEFRSSGSGEPATAPVMAAVANAFFDATGKRIRNAPMTPAKIRGVLNATA